MIRMMDVWLKVGSDEDSATLLLEHQKMSVPCKLVLFPLPVPALEAWDITKTDALKEA